MLQKLFSSDSNLARNYALVELEGFNGWLSYGRITNFIFADEENQKRGIDNLLSILFKFDYIC
jgi:hypothetical protein